MDIVLTVLEIVAPVFLLGCIGYGWVKLGFEYRLAFVTKLSMTLAVPCLIFISLVETEIDPNALTLILLASAVAYGAITIAFYVIVKLLKLEIRSFLPPLIFGNTGNVGLPLALFAFGSEGLGFAIVVFAAMAIWSFTYGVWIVSGGGSLVRVIKEPMVGATLLGALFMWQDWDVPVFLGNSLNLVGQMAIPLMLITLGVAVARLQPGRIMQAIWLSLLKAAICIGIAAFVGHQFGLPPIAQAVLILQVGTPVAVTSYMMAEKYGADSDAVAGLVVASTLLSVVVFPLVLAFLI